MDQSAAVLWMESQTFQALTFLLVKEKQEAVMIYQ